MKYEDGLIYFVECIPDPMYVGPSVTTYAVEYRTRGKAWYHFYQDKSGVRLELADLERIVYYWLEKLGATSSPDDLRCKLESYLHFFTDHLGRIGRRRWMKRLDQLWGPSWGFQPIS